MRVKNGIIILSLLFISLSVHTALVEPVSAANININSSMSNSQIQSILNNAVSGDTINFLGQLYKDLQLTINKKLNIITSMGTELIGSGTGVAVFTINGPQASGTSINGFNITGSGIIINNTSNVTISNTNISSAKGSAVNITRSTNINIKNSIISNSNTGISVTNSKNTNITSSSIKNNKKDGITLTNSINTTINKTQITDNNENGIQVIQSNSTIINSTTLKGNGKSTNGSAVYISHSTKVNITRSIVQNNSEGISMIDSSNIGVNNSTVVDNNYDGILISGITQNVTISYTDLERNYNGISLNSNSKKGNIHISSNKITNNGHNNEGNGIYLGPQYAQSKTDYIGHNAIYGNVGWDVNGHDTPGNVHFAPNFYGDPSKRCCAMDYDPSIEIRISRTESNTYTVWFYDPITGSWVSDFPDGVSVTISVTGLSESGGTVTKSSVTKKTESGIVSAMVDTDNSNTDNGNSDNTIIGTSTGLSASIDSNSPIDHQFDPQETGPGDDGPGGSGDGNGPSTDGTGGGPGGSAPSSGAVSGPSSSTGLLEATAAAGLTGSPTSSGNNGKDPSQNPKTAQELFIDNTVKNPQVWGIIGIVVLLVAVFGAYYRTDFMNMIKKSKK